MKISVNFWVLKEKSKKIEDFLKKVLHIFIVWKTWLLGIELPLYEERRSREKDSLVARVCIPSFWIPQEH